MTLDNERGSEISVAQAIARARHRLGLDAAVAATAWRSRREDDPGDSYYLVILGDPDRALGVAAVEAATGELMEWTKLPGTGPHLTTGPEEAMRHAAASGGHPELVWRSSRASRSLLYPVWRVETGRGTVYVDQQGVVWDSLEPDETGG